MLYTSVNFIYYEIHQLLQESSKGSERWIIKVRMIVVEGLTLNQEASAWIWKKPANTFETRQPGIGLIKSDPMQTLPSKHVAKDVC